MIVLKIDENNILTSIRSQLDKRNLFDNNDRQEAKALLEGKPARFTFSYQIVGFNYPSAGQKHGLVVKGLLNDVLEEGVLKIIYLSLGPTDPNLLFKNPNTVLYRKGSLKTSLNYIQDLWVKIELIK